MDIYKEKYEQALERAKVINPGTADYEVAVKIFPELKKSEDSEIRKGLIQHLKTLRDWTPGELSPIKVKEHYDAWIAWCEKQGKSAFEVWKDMRLEVYQQASGNRHEANYSDDSTKMFSLNDIDEIFQKIAEKQGEQKPEIKYIYPKFRVGDVIEPAEPNGHDVPVRVKYIGEGAYSCESDDRKAFLSLPICYENDYVLTKQKPAEWTDKDWYYYNKLEYFLEVQDHYSPTESSSSYQKDVHETLLWLKSLHFNKHVTWSEEDESHIGRILSYLESFKAYNIPHIEPIKREIDWLKSLKRRMKGE